MDIKLIISDVDGTLIDNTEQTSAEFDTLADLTKKHKLPLTLASGRCFTELQMFKERLSIDMPLIVNNGAGAILNGKSIWDNYINPLHIKEAILCADKMNMAIVFGDGISEKAYKYNAYIQNQINKFSRYNHFYIPLESEWPSLKIQKVLIIDPEKEGRIDLVIEKLKPYQDSLSIVRYNSRSVDIMPKNTTKASGILKLIEILGIDAKNVMAIGDAQNDIEMLSTVGLGVAVENAHEELKKCADYTCKNKNVKGVIEAIERFYLKI